MRRLAAGRLELTDSSGPGGSTSYVVSVDKKGETTTTINEFLHYTLRLTQYMAVEYPSKRDLNEARKRYIANDISSVEKALFSYDFDSALWGWRASMATSRPVTRPGAAVRGFVERVKSGVNGRRKTSRGGSPLM